MPRPRRNGPLKLKGKYYAELYDGNRRRSLSLRTDNLEIALQRYGSGVKELQRRIRKEHEAAKPQERLAWLPEQVEEVKGHFDGSDFTAQDIAEITTGKRQSSNHEGFDDKRAEELAEHLAGISRLTWDELVANAATVRRRKEGKEYSTGWYRNIKLILSEVDFYPEGLTPERIRKWQDDQEAKGKSSSTLKNWLSALQGLVERAITSGYRRDLAPNPFKLIDFSISKDVANAHNYYCPTPDDYLKLFNEVLPQQPEKWRLGIELMVWTGCRISAVPYLSRSAQPGWLDVPDVDGTKGGGRCPVPMDIWTRARTTKINPRALNKVLKQVHPELCNHGLRSGFKMLSRLAGLDHLLDETLLMHKLPGLEETYGGKGYPDEALKKGSTRVWAELAKILDEQRDLIRTLDNEHLMRTMTTTLMQEITSS